MLVLVLTGVWWGSLGIEWCPYSHTLERMSSFSLLQNERKEEMRREIRLGERKVEERRGEEI